MYKTRHLSWLGGVFVALLSVSGVSAQEQPGAQFPPAPAASAPTVGATTTDQQQAAAVDALLPAVPQAQLVDKVAPTEQTLEIPANPDGVAAEIAEINERLATLSAQLAELELRAKIATKMAEIEKLESTEKPKNFDLPAIRDIEAVNGEYSATLVVRKGHKRIVRVGDKIDDWTVDRITVNGVRLRSSTETVNLTFGKDELKAKTGAGGIGMPSLPGL